jgi:superfamily II DNA or RNA helicase
MQSPASMHGVSFRKNPRNGQTRVLDAIAEKSYLCVKLPTGYGKTFTACASYAIKQRQGINRALFIFPTDAQLKQFVNDGPSDLLDAGVTGPRVVIDLRFYGIEALKKHKMNSAQVYAITVQSLCGNAGQATVNSLMSSGKWMVIVDEYHHYGIEKTWGKSVSALSYDCLLAMSATPYRADDDSAFGAPEVNVQYRTAVAEGAVKRLLGHAYSYAIDAILEDGDVISFTTDELAKEAGSDNPEAIEKLRVERRMRWSPKYVSPLVVHPIDRMLSNRVSSGLKLQVIIGAMCVSHAKLVCEQVKSMYPELSIDWVGTGTDGKSSDENGKILEAFCPQKDDFGNRNPTLDVLVHVGMAGEGLDSVLVSEVVHLNKASKNNSNDQENGRAARYCVGGDGHPVIGNINFDSSSDYAKMGYVGEAIMEAMDSLPPSPDDDGDDGDDNTDSEPSEIPELPDEPTIQIFDMRLQNIDSGDPGVQLMGRVMQENGIISDNMNFAEMAENPNHPGWNDVITFYKTMRHKETEPLREPAMIAQWQEQIKNAVSAVTGRAINAMKSEGMRIEKTLIGDIKKRINGRKKRDCGAITENIDVLRTHYTWVKNLERAIISTGVPEWLL